MIFDNSVAWEGDCYIWLDIERGDSSSIIFSSHMTFPGEAVSDADINIKSWIFKYTVFNFT